MSKSYVSSFEGKNHVLGLIQCWTSTKSLTWLLFPIFHVHFPKFIFRELHGKLHSSKPSAYLEAEIGTLLEGVWEIVFASPQWLRLRGVKDIYKTTISISLLSDNNDQIYKAIWHFQCAICSKFNCYNNVMTSILLIPPLYNDKTEAQRG